MKNNNNGLTEALSSIGAIASAGFGLAAVVSGLGLPALALGALSGALATNAALSGKINLLQEDKNKMQEELARISKRLVKAEADLKSGLEERRKLSDRLEFYLEGSDPAILDLPVVRDRITFLQGEIRRLDSQLAKSNKDLAEAISKNQKLEAEASDYKRLIKETATKLSESSEELRVAKLDLERTEEEIDREIKLRVMMTINNECSKAVVRAVEEKVLELQQAHALIEQLKTKLQDDEMTFEELQKNTIPGIGQSFNQSLSARDSLLLEQSGTIELLQQKIAELEAPRLFPGVTYADNAGNQIIEHFSRYGVIFDALEASVIPGGYQLRFKCDRNSDQTKLSGEEFGKIINQRGLMGISTQPLTFKIDQLNFIVEVDTFYGGVPEVAKKSGHENAKSDYAIGLEKARTHTTKGFVPAKAEPTPHREEFIALGCFPADQFEEVVKKRFAARVFIGAGSTGFKSPVLEMVAIAVAKANQASIWLVNPVPGSPKDWFKIPGLILPGGDSVAKCASVIEKAHREFLSRRNNLPDAQERPFIVLAIDEANAIARECEEWGTMTKDFYQLSDHTRMAFVTAGQGINISNFSGGASKKATGNASKLMEEDYENTTRVFLGEKVNYWLNKKYQGAGKGNLLEKSAQLSALCRELNESEGKVNRPTMGEGKKVSPDAYRFALCVCPGFEPFFFQLPAFSSLSLDGLEFPAAAQVTSPNWGKTEKTNDQNLTCYHCGSTDLKSAKPYVDGTLRYRCNSCKHIVDSRKL
jgi:hypothetical protein